MTVASAVSRVAYTGSGITGPFAIPFYFLANGDLRVIKTQISNGAETVLTITTDYTVTGAGDEAGGSLSLVVALSSSYTLTIIREPAATQGADYTPNDPFPAATHETALDRLTMLVQMLIDRVKRAIKVPESVSTDQVVPGSNWVSRASKLLGFDASGVITTYPATSGVYGVLRDYQVATAGQTVFNLGFVYSLGIYNLRVFVNGLLQRINADYTESSTSQVTFTYGLQVGDEVEFFAGQETVGADGDASSVSYTPAGAGAVVSNVRDKLREWVSVKDFGAVGDGVTDDYAAIAAAVAASDHVFVPAGTYKIGTTLAITGDQTITGPHGGTKSSQTAVLNFTGGSGPLFNLQTNEYGGVCISNLKITGGNGEYAIITQRPQCVFENLHMETFTGGGIKCIDTTPGSWGTVIRNVKWVGPDSQTSYTGFYISSTGGNGFLIENCLAIYGSIGIDVDQVETLTIKNFNANLQDSAHSSLSSVNQCAVRLSGIDYKRAISLDNCYLEACTYAVYAEKCESLSITNCFIDDVTAGIGGIFLKDASVKNVTIANNYIIHRGAAEIAIEVDNAENVLIENNQIDASGAGGVAIKNTVTGGNASKTTVLRNNKVIAGLTTDTNDELHDITPVRDSFTPAITFGGGNTGITYALRTGRYRKLGRVCYFDLYIELTSKGSSVGAAVVTGLPFTSKNIANTFHMVPVNIGAMSLTGSPQCFIQSNATSITMQQQTLGVGATLTDAAFTNTTSLIMSGSYEIEP